MKIVIISGTPGTGKTALARKLTKFLTAESIDVNAIINKNSLKEKYDHQRQTYEVDIRKLNAAIKRKLKQYSVESTVIIDSHLSHYLSGIKTALCIITTCNLKLLLKRLKQRKYRKTKIRENLDAEIFDVCFLEATAKHKNIMKIDTTKPITLNTLKQIKKLL